MENILWLYSLAYAPEYPVVCFDERPCFLIGDRVAPIPMQKGRAAKQHYACEKNGSCCLLAAIEPLKGKRLAKVYQRRTKKEFTHFMRELAAAYPEAKKIRLVLDNLNTHCFSSFYQHLPAHKAFEFYFTPKSASWLNMIEIEFSALARQCLNRRIPNKKQLKKEILAIVKEREKKQIKIQWQFSIKNARSKMNRHYVKVNTENNV